MTRCPWFDHDVEPDPAAQGLTTGETGVCQVCLRSYQVVKTLPYLLICDAPPPASPLERALDPDIVDLEYPLDGPASYWRADSGAVRGGLDRPERQLSGGGDRAALQAEHPGWLELGEELELDEEEELELGEEIDAETQFKRVPAAEKGRGAAKKRDPVKGRGVAKKSAAAKAHGVTKKGAPAKKRGVAKTRASASKPARTRTPPRAQDVMLSATYPRSIRPGDSFLVDIALHLRAAGPRASARRAVASERAVVRLRRGARLQMSVRPPPGITAAEPVRNVVWRPPRSSVSFPLQSSERIRSGTHILTVAVSTAGPRGVEIARFDVALEIDRAAATTAPARSKVIRRLPTSYFASYARRDWNEVKGRVSAIVAIGGDVFIDCLDIREGARWEAEIRNQVQKRDGFLLFWSRAARESKWVGREWRHRLRHCGLDSITPNALESPQACPPPSALARLQFGSRFLELVRAEVAPTLRRSHRRGRDAE